MPRIRYTASGQFIEWTGSIDDFFGLIKPWLKGVEARHERLYQQRADNNRKQRSKDLAI